MCAVRWKKLKIATLEKRKEEDFFSVERKITLVHVGFFTFNFIGKLSFVFNLLRILLGVPYRRGFISDIKLT